MWNTRVSHTRFERADIRNAALGTLVDGKANTWKYVDFQGADMRGSHFQAGTVRNSRFDNAKLKGVRFDQVDLRDLVFVGRVENVLFDERYLQGSRIMGAPLRSVDFSAALLENTEFYGCIFIDVRWPSGVWLIPRYPEVSARAAELLAADQSIEARMARAHLTLISKQPGDPDSVGVINLADQMVEGEAYTELLVGVLNKALEQVS